MSPEFITLLMFGSLLLWLSLGVPLTFALGGLAMVFTFFLWSSDALMIVATSVSYLQMSIILVCAPLFIFMGVIMEKSGIADALFQTIYQWFGPIRGGLAMGTVLICTIFAAMVGVSSVGTITMGIIALPAMFKRNYNKTIAMGPIMAGGALGILIPPSVQMIFYSFMARISVGQMFLGGVIPGFLLSSLFITYIGIRCWLQPRLGPSVPLEETVSWREKVILLRAIILPVLLVFMVLGSIFFGIASPTESAAVGAIGSLLCAALHRRLNWKVISEGAMTTLKLTSMVMWILIGSKCFTAVYISLGGQEVVNNFITSLEVNRWVILIAMQVSLFFLGMIMDPLGIIMITVPIYIPIITQLGFNPLWFGIVFTVNTEMAFLTPPFGFTLFYMKALVPKGITMGDIYRSIIPFVLLQATGLILVIIFPQLALWLPSKMITT